MDLVARLQAGNVDAFETFYRQHSGKIYTLASRMAGSPEDGEDCLDFVRSRPAKMNKLTETLDAETSFEPAARRETPIAKMDLARAVERLPEGCREAFVLRHDLRAVARRPAL